MTIVDIHPHIISGDERRYPPAPLFGKRSDWSQERPSTVEALIAEMDRAGVAKAAVVHSSTTYGFDNSYVVDGCAQYPDRLAAVGSVDVLQPDAPERIRAWAGRGGSVAQLWACTRPSSWRSLLMDRLLQCAAAGVLASWNCAVSVECAIAVVLAWPPEAAIATASK